MADVQMPEQMDEQKSEAPEKLDDEKVAKELKTRTDASKRNRKQMVDEWKHNVELRLGHPIKQYTGGTSVDGNDNSNRSEINPDWSLAKAKIANLFSQVPTVQGAHENEQYAGAVYPFMKALNYELGDKRTNMAAAMEEELNDVVNAAGVGAVHLGWAARFEMKMMPKQDVSMLPPQMVQQMQQMGQIEMVETPMPVNGRFFASRISPRYLLWPSEFVGSDFNQADYMGYEGTMPWGVAQPEFKLTEEEKEQVLGGSPTTSQAEDSLRSTTDSGGTDVAQVVKFTELYYWRYRVDPNCKSFDEIWRIVWIEGLDKPKIHEPYKGQKLNDKTGQFIGVRKLPIQVLTLTYISDNPVPPSDSSAGRPQVNDMRRSRSQMFQQRERSIPIRWYDTNRVDPLVADTLMRGTWQGMIPTNGNGSASIGEIARASYPSEDISFDIQVQKDLMQVWSMGPEQVGQPTGRQTKEQTQSNQANFATRIGQERGKVAAHFLNCCEVLAGLMVMFGDFPTLTDQEKQGMQQAWDYRSIVADIVFKIRPDSTIVLDVKQRLQNIFQFINMTAKSGYVNVKPLITEAAELSGVDPSKVIVDPQPKPPEEPNVSLRFTGKEDLMNPLVMAFMIKGNRAPSPEQLQQAIELLQKASGLPQPQAPGQPGAGLPGHPPPPPGGPGGSAIQPGEDTKPEYALANKVAKRSRDMGGSS